MQATHLMFPEGQLSLGGRSWRLKEAGDAEVAALMRHVGGDELLARLLALRGVVPGDVADFLDPKLKRLFPDPSTFADMDRAAELILDAIIEGKHVTVFADYDVDGGTSSAQLARYFRAWGRELGLYVPDRITEGYGPSPEAFRAIKATGCDLVITVDCGAAAYKALEEADRIGLPVIVLDHHLMQGELPKALALVNPNRPDCQSGCGHLAAAGVVFVLLVALNRLARERGIEPPSGSVDPMELLDLCALGTICDMAPLHGVNRAFVNTGLKVLAQGQNVGIRALCDVAGVGTADSVYHAGFVLGPRLNAGGRVGDPWLAAKLLACDDREEALALAEELHALNAARREAEKEILDRAVADTERMLAKSGETNIIVVDGEGWHPGIIGIVAGRLKDAFHRPTIVIGHGEEFGELAKGSARSVAGINIGALIGEAAKQGLLTSGGGHAMAAGLSVLPSGIAAFREWIEARMQGQQETLSAAATLEIDALIATAAITRDTLERIETAGPYGAGAPEPLFALSGVTLDSVRRIGENHLKCVVRDETASATVLAWRSADTPIGEVLQPGQRVHIAGHIKADDWNGRKGVRFDLRDAIRA